MIVSMAVVTGFKQEIRNKVIGFGSHIQIVNYDSNNSYETRPISLRQPFLSELDNIKGIKYIQAFATKPGMIKTDQLIQGIVFKGLAPGYYRDFFEKSLLEGHLPDLNDSVRSNEIIISSSLAKLLQVGVNDRLVLYFINEKEFLPRLLQLTVCGIYHTGFGEFDQLFVLGDIKQVQRINNWTPEQISGFEIGVDDFKYLNLVEQQVTQKIIHHRNEHSDLLRSISITRLYPQIFDWLSILDMNVWIILVLMILVAAFNMISALLVLILEKAQMIGVLKALGSKPDSIRKVFIYLSIFLTGRGLLWGNIVGVSIVVLQSLFHIIRLDPSSYYVEYVPMNFSILHLLALNLGTLLITTLALILPSLLVNKISPDKTMRFD